MDTSDDGSDSSGSSSGSTPRECVGFMFGNTTYRLRLVKDEGRKLFDEVRSSETSHAVERPAAPPPSVQDAYEALDELGNSAGDVEDTKMELTWVCRIQLRMQPPALPLSKRFIWRVFKSHRKMLSSRIKLIR